MKLTLYRLVLLGPLAAAIVGGCARNSPGMATMSWTEASRACPAGYRLPTRDEMIALLSSCPYAVTAGDAGVCQPCASSPTCAAMFGEDYGRYWTWTPYSGPEGPGRWVVYLSNGRVAHVPENASYNVRCVREVL